MEISLRILLTTSLSALAIGACVRAETTIIGTARPSLGLNCPVEVQPNAPGFRVVDIATSEAKCHFMKGRGACIERLKGEACKLGANVVYGFREGKIGEYSVITATLAAKAEESAPAPQVAESAAAPVEATGDCSPPCSPGYQCEAKTCQPVCNPVCSPGYACSQDRTCQPLAPAASAQSSL